MAQHTILKQSDETESLVCSEISPSTKNRSEVKVLRSIFFKSVGKGVYVRAKFFIEEK